MSEEACRVQEGPELCVCVCACVCMQSLKPLSSAINYPKAAKRKQEELDYSLY